MNTVKIEGTKRGGQGKKNSTGMRAEGLVPCNLYGIGENVSFSVPTKVIRALIYSPEFRMAEISLDGANHRVTRLCDVNSLGS